MDKFVTTREHIEREFNGELTECPHALAALDMRNVSDEQKARICAAFSLFCGEIQAALGY